MLAIANGADPTAACAKANDALKAPSTSSRWSRGGTRRIADVRPRVRNAPPRVVAGGAFARPRRAPMTARPFRRRSRRDAIGAVASWSRSSSIMGLTSMFPTLYSIYMSFFDWNWGQRFNFVGLQNYVVAARRASASGPRCSTRSCSPSRRSAVEFVIGLGLALVVHRVRLRP